MPDCRKEAAFYIALMGCTLRSDDGNQAVLDMDGWGSAVFKEAPERARAMVESISWVIGPWSAETVRAKLLARGLMPIADEDGQGFESFHVKDPNRFGFTNQQQ